MLPKQPRRQKTPVWKTKEEERDGPAEKTSKVGQAFLFHIHLTVGNAALLVCHFGLAAPSGPLFSIRMRQVERKCSLESSAGWREDCWSHVYWFLNYKWPHGWSKKAENENDREGDGDVLLQTVTAFIWHAVKQRESSEKGYTHTHTVAHKRGGIERENEEECIERRGEVLS